MLEGLAEAPEGEGQYTSGRQVAPDNRLERPEDGSLSPAAQTPELGPEPPPPSDATRPRPQRKGEEPGDLSPGDCHERAAIPHAIPGWWGDIPRRRRGVAGSRGGVSRERGTCDIPGNRSPCPPKGREGGEEGRRERGKGKVKPGKRCWENKAGLSKADTDTDTQA